MLSSYKYIIALVVAWLVAHLMKVCLLAIKTRHLTLLPGPGNMPSGHSAVVVSILTMIGLTEGMTSALFGLALAVAVIVMYDATHVRLATGRQAEVIGDIIKKTKLDIRAPKIVRGHTYIEVLVGAAIGFLVSYIVFITT